MRICPRKKIYFKSNLTGNIYCMHRGGIYRYLYFYVRPRWDPRPSIARGLKSQPFAVRLARKDWEILATLPVGVEPYEG